MKVPMNVGRLVEDELIQNATRLLGTPMVEVGRNCVVVLVDGGQQAAISFEDNLLLTTTQLQQLGYE